MARRRVNRKKFFPCGHKGFGAHCHRCGQADQYDRAGYAREAEALRGLGKGPHYSIHDLQALDRADRAERLAPG